MPNRDSLLLTVSRENKQEGRDPTLLPQSLNCGVAADFLALSTERLGDLLGQLERRGIIAPCPPQGLHITDPVALEGFGGAAY
jgi:CRP/FNR family transcriptional regulator